jgi:hypothetical protein
MIEEHLVALVKARAEFNECVSRAAREGVGVSFDIVCWDINNVRTNQIRDLEMKVRR